MKATGLILAGGKSSRMGQDKSLLPFAGETMLQRAVAELRPEVEEILIVGNQQKKYGIPDTREIADIFPGMGPLAGIHAGLSAAASDYVFVAACDMPYFDGRLARFLIDQAPGYDAVVPQIGNFLEPLFAVYAKTCLPHIQACLENNIRTAYAFYPMVKVNFVPEALIRRIADPQKTFFNVNTPEDYAKIGAGEVKEAKVAKDPKSQTNHSDDENQSNHSPNVNRRRED